MVITLTIILAFIVMAACASPGGGQQAGTTPAETAPAQQQQAAAVTTEPDAPRELDVAVVRFGQHVDWDEMTVWQYFEEQTGIQVNWIYVHPDGIQETRNLMVAAGDLPCAFNSFAWTQTEVALYAREGIFLAIDDMLPLYGPNTLAFFERNPEIKQALVMPDGHIYGWPRTQEHFAMGTAMLFRRAWIDELGMGVPGTTDELMAVLTAMGETFDSNIVYSHAGGVGDGLDPYNALRGTLLGAWGLANRGTSVPMDVHPDNPTQVRFWGADPRMREVTGFIRDMFDRNLIDPDSITQDEPQAGAKLNLDPPQVGMVTTTIIGVHLASGGRVGADDEFIGLEMALEGPYGDQMWSSVRQRVFRPANFVITNQVRNFPAAVEMGDFWMCMDNSEVFLWGHYSHYWSWDSPERNFRIRAPWITDDDQGRSYDQMNSTFSSRPGGFWFGVDLENFDPNLSQHVANRAMMPYVPSMVWENFSFTEDEMRVLSTIGVDVNTYFQEANTAFVHGTMSLEDDWDTYIATLENIGLQRVIDVYQAAYDRFLAAGGRSS